MATQPIQRLTEEQYLRIERDALEKSEYHDGQMFAMAGGSPNRALLSNRIGSLLDRAVPPGCHVFNSELRIKIAGSTTYSYADCTVV